MVILSAQHCITHDGMTLVKEPNIIEAKMYFICYWWTGGVCLWFPHCSESNVTRWDTAVLHIVILGHRWAQGKQQTLDTSSPGLQPLWIPAHYLICPGRQSWAWSHFSALTKTSQTCGDKWQVTGPMWSVSCVTLTPVYLMVTWHVTHVITILVQNKCQKIVTAKCSIFLSTPWSTD